MLSKQHVLCSNQGSSNPPEPHLALLTSAETFVIRLVAHGLENKEIARELHLCEGTVKNRVASSLEKLKIAHPNVRLENRVHLALLYWGVHCTVARTR
jgi:DNA-binding NarL/FixJ family response regulator